MIGPVALQIRQMVASDAPLIAAAFADMNKTVQQYEVYWQENLAGQRVTLVALLDSAVAGYTPVAGNTNVLWASAYEPFRRWGIPEINDLNTATHLRRQGIGSRLIAVAEDLVRRSGHQTIGIGVGVTPDYAMAQRLYPRLGYVADGLGVHPDPWGGAVYSTKVLPR